MFGGSDWRGQITLLLALRFWGYWELMLPALRGVLCHFSFSNGRYVATGSLLPWSLRRFLLREGGSGLPGGLRRASPTPVWAPSAGAGLSSQNAFLELQASEVPEGPWAGMERWYPD